MNQVLRLGLLAAMLLVSSERRSSIAQQAEEITLEAISKAWQSRQDHSKSARFAWNARKVMPAGYISSIVAELPPPKRDSKADPRQIGVIPPSEAVLNIPSRLSFEGN